MERRNLERRLAAILAADVVGYSLLMGTDEVGTLQRLKARRQELVDPSIAARRGRSVKATGDGLLVEFASVVDAVACAVAVQRGMSSRNAEAPRGRQLAGIPDARFVPLPSRNHLILESEPAFARFTEEIRAFLRT